MVKEYVRKKRKYELFRVTVEQPSRVIGVASLVPITFGDPQLKQFSGSPYISVIGLHQRYRGHRCKGERMGDLVLRDMLSAIDADGRWGKGPDVFAFVDPRNAPSCDLFERFSFQVLYMPPEEATEADALYWRPEVLGQ